MSSSADFTTGDEHRQHHNLTFAVLVLAGCTFALLQSLVAPALPVPPRGAEALVSFGRGWARP